MSYRSRLGAVIAIAAILAGCGKKDADTQQTTPIPELSETGRKTSSDNPDIFDEFYDDQASKDAGKQESAFDETFSTGDFGYKPEFAPDGRYVVQVSCVVSRAVAESHVRKLEDKGYPAYIAEVTNPIPDLMGQYYRVRIGGFAGVSAAKKFGEQALVPAGYEYWVDNRSNDNIGMGGYGLGASSASEYSDYSGSTTTETSTWQEPSYTPEPTPASTSTNSWGSTTESTSSTGDNWGTTTAEPAVSEPPAPPAAAPETSTGSAAPTTTPEPAATPASTPASTGTETNSGWDDWGDDW